MIYFLDLDSIPWRLLPWYLGIVVIFELLGYLILRRTVPAITDSIPSWRVAILFVMRMLACWVPFFVFGSLALLAPDGGGMALAGLILLASSFALLANVLLIVRSFFVPGFRKMLDGYCAVLILYGFAYIANLFILNSYIWNLYIVHLTLWTAFAFLLFGLRFFSHRGVVILASCGIVIAGLFIFIATLPNSYLLDTWQHSRAESSRNPAGCLNVVDGSEREKCIMDLADRSTDPSLCHLTTKPSICLQRIFSNETLFWECPHAERICHGEYLPVAGKVCNGITDSSARQFCIQESEHFNMDKLALVAADPSMCQQSSPPEKKSYCMWRSETGGYRPVNCSALSDVTVRELCLAIHSYTSKVPY